MTFANIANGSKVLVDANTLVYHFIAHPQFGAAATQLLERIEQGDVAGFTAAHVVGELAHRLMTIEACAVFGWPTQGIARRLRNHPTEVQQLRKHRQALDELPLLRVAILPVTGPLLSVASDLSIQFGLLLNDALCIAVMRNQGIDQIASNDADFDRVPGVTRFSPT
jgi:predicted nucleic acid-binding protein